MLNSFQANISKDKQLVDILVEEKQSHSAAPQDRDFP